MGSRPLLSRSGCISEEVNEWLGADDEVLVPFYRGAVVFKKKIYQKVKCKSVLVPFYRGAVVFYDHAVVSGEAKISFSSPFIEERLYFEKTDTNLPPVAVLVPFYRGAVVFGKYYEHIFKSYFVLVPFYRGAVVFPVDVAGVKVIDEFSSPFIEERLYF